MFKKIKEAIDYYQKYKPTMFILNLVSSLVYFFILFLLSLHFQYYLENWSKLSLINKLFFPLTTSIHLHIINMLIYDKNIAEYVLEFYNKIIFGTFTILILNPSILQNLRDFFDVGLIVYWGINEETFTVWLPLSYIFLNVIYLYRKRFGARPRTKKEIEKELKRILAKEEELRKKIIETENEEDM